MIAKALKSKMLEKSTPAVFSPEDHLAWTLNGIFRAEGLDMYRVLRAEPTRGRLLRQADRVQSAWRRCERTGRWDAFRREVRLLGGLWLDLLNA